MRYAAAALSAALFGLSFSGCARHGGAYGQGAGGFAMPVAAALITLGTITSNFSVTSTVVPLQQASLSSVVSGNVLEVNAQIGQHVRRGELLVKIDDSTLRAQRATAQGRLAQLQATYGGGVTSAQAQLSAATTVNNDAQANLRRNQTLFNQGYVSQSDLDVARDRATAAEASYKAAVVANQNASISTGQSAASADLRAATAAVNALDTQIAQTNVSAPFDGIVTQRNVDPGSLAAPGTVLMQVSQLDPVFVDAGIPSGDLHGIAVGTPVTITASDIPGRAWHATVSYLNAAADPGTLTYRARIRVANPDLALRGGEIVDVAFVQERKTSVLIAPRAAVYETDAGYSMFIIDQGKAASVPIELGLANDQQAEVSGQGLKPGVMAILNHSVTLQPGTPVQVLPPGGGAPGAGGPPKGAPKNQTQATKSPHGSS
jgi:HlyD family secretion protein